MQEWPDLKGKGLDIAFLLLRIEELKLVFLSSKSVLGLINRRLPRVACGAAPSRVGNPAGECAGSVTAGGKR
jgi:hypothetical protein